MGVSMNDKVKGFVKDYNDAIETEFNKFNAEAQRFAYEETGRMNPEVTARLDKDITTETNKFEQQKSKLAGYELSTQEAKEVLKPRQDDGSFSAEPMQGPDCYRFMNFQTRNNKEVALEALKNDPKQDVVKHFPPAVKERVDGKENKIKALESAVGFEKLQNQMKPKQQAQTHKINFAM
jgi:hypothetical protein